MTRKILESYQANKRLIERNNKKIEEEQQKEIPVVSGKVKGSSHEFPYIERHFTVQMDEPVESDKSVARIKVWNAEIKIAEDEVQAVDEFISSIDDVRDREIFTCRYVDGMKAVAVAKHVGYTHGRISQIISKYIKD